MSAAPADGPQAKPAKIASSLLDMAAVRPNIIFIITDQQRFDTIRALGYDYVDTPNIDRLVNEGVTFTNCHVPAPSCAPCRASLFMGQYPHNTGVLKNGDRWDRSWVELLRDSGYHCVNVGKMHQVPYAAPCGFHQRFPIENKDRFMEGRFFFDEWDKAIKANRYSKPGRLSYRNLSDYKERLGAFEWPLPERLHADVFTADTACWWLETYPQTEPLFLQIGFPGPHPPYDPPADRAEKYLQRDLPLMEVSQQDLDAQPAPYKGMIEHNCEVDHDSVVHVRNPTEEQRKRQRAYYLANVEMIDEGIGKILDALDAAGYLNDSIVVFTSDHGDALTDHGHSQKWTFYDTITRMPLVVWSPKRYQGPRKIDGLCSLMDVGPTILEMAGAEVPAKMEAKSLLPAVEGESWTPRRYVFSEQSRDTNFTTSDFETMVRAKDWKLVHFVDSPDGQLFDLVNDPDEVDNLWWSTAPEHQRKKRELLDVMLNWRMRSACDQSGWRNTWPAQQAH